MPTIELVWPEKQVLDALDYSCDLSDELEAAETITSVVASVRPSGTGELSIGGAPLAQNLVVQDKLIGVWLIGGIGGRGYLVRFVVTTSEGRVFDILATLLMSRTLMTFPVLDAPNQDFSTETTWTSS